MKLPYKKDRGCWDISLSKVFQVGPGRAGPPILRFSRYIEKTSLARCARSLVIILIINCIICKNTVPYTSVPSSFIRAVCRFWCLIPNTLLLLALKVAGHKMLPLVCTYNLCRCLRCLVFSQLSVVMTNSMMIDIIHDNTWLCTPPSDCVVGYTVTDF